MKTSKPISTISYNSEQFLKSKLQELLEAGSIEFWCYIKHHKESDDTKDHIHLLICPNERIDTGELKNEFMEIDATKPDKPLGVIMFCTSIVDEWFLYNMHYKPYLDSKLLEREYHYSKEDFVYSDEDTFEFLFLHAFHESKFVTERKLFKLITDKKSKGSDLVVHGAVPLQNACGLLALKKLRFSESQGETFV